MVGVEGGRTGERECYGQFYSFPNFVNKD
jgi:hypothetical protein